MKKKKYKTGGPIDPIYPFPVAGTPRQPYINSSFAGTYQSPKRESMRVIPRPLQTPDFGAMARGYVASTEAERMQAIQSGNQAKVNELQNNAFNILDWANTERALGNYQRPTNFANGGPIDQNAMKKKIGQKSLGGQLLQTGVSFIPVAGQILAPLVGMADQQMDAQKAAEEQQKLLRQQQAPIQIKNPYGLALGGPIKELYNPNLANTDKNFQDWYNKNTVEGKNNIPFSNNLDYDYYSFYKNGESANYKGGHFPDTYKLPNHETFSDESLYATPENQGGHWKGESFKKGKGKFGNAYANGGILNDMFKQYNTGSHQSGNDLQVDTQGSPSPDGTNSVQNKENSYKVGDNQYVMSDALTNPKTGNKFNVDAMNINKKYPKARFHSDQKNALDLEMKNLSKKNDVVRQGEESKQMAGGGPILGNALRDATNYWKNNQYVSPDQVPMADSNMFVAPKMGIPDDYTGIQPALDSTDPVPQNKGQLSGQVPVSNPGLSAGDIAGRDAEAKYDAELAAKKASGKGILDPTKDRDTTGVLDPKSANNIALGMKGLALAGSVYDALQPAEKEKLLTPNYSKSDAYMQSANIDFTQAKQDAMGVSNIGANMNRSLSGNAAQYQGREQSRLAQLQDSLGRISEGENNAQSQLNLTKGTYEQQKAVDYSNREYANQQGNMQNQAAARGFGRQLASDLSQIGSSFNLYAENTKLNQNTADMAKFTNSQIMATINAKNPNFKLQDNVVENFLSGKTSLDETLAFVPQTPEDQAAAKKILLEAQAKIKAKDGK